MSHYGLDLRIKNNPSLGGGFGLDQTEPLFVYTCLQWVGHLDQLWEVEADKEEKQLENDEENSEGRKSLL